MGNKLAHLQMIQAVVTRMAQNSFSLKGWSVTLASALLALSTNVPDKTLVRLLALLPLLMFWILDGYFLGQERRFRQLYDSVRLDAEDGVDFAMSRKGLPSDWLGPMFSKTLAIFYIALLLGVVGITFLAKETSPNVVSPPSTQTK